MLFRAVLIDDIENLRDIALETFIATYQDLNNPHDFNEYLAQAFSKDQLVKEISDPFNLFYFIDKDAVTAGYVKLKQHPKTKKLEICRLYVKQGFKGLGIGSSVIDFAVTLTKKLNLNTLMLGVWEKNDVAINFYLKKGFVKTGEHIFQIGNDAQTDWVMCKIIG